MHMYIRPHNTIACVTSSTILVYCPQPLLDTAATQTTRPTFDTIRRSPERAMHHVEQGARRVRSQHRSRQLVGVYFDDRDRGRDGEGRCGGCQFAKDVRG